MLATLKAGSCSFVFAYITSLCMPPRFGWPCPILTGGIAKTGFAHQAFGVC